MPIIVINSGDSGKFDDLANTRDMLLRYHSPSCGHCLAMESEWKALDNEQSLKERNIAIVDIDVGIAYNINHPSAKTALSQGVPSIYFIKKNQMFEYSGERKAKKIAEFAILHLEQDPYIRMPSHRLLANAGRQSTNRRRSRPLSKRIRYSYKRKSR